MFLLINNSYLIKVKWNQNTSQTYGDQNSVQSQILTLIKSVQMVMRCNHEKINFFNYID